jgi:hypothetical protein
VLEVLSHQALGAQPVDGSDKLRRELPTAG